MYSTNSSLLSEVLKRLNLKSTLSEETLDEVIRIQIKRAMRVHIPESLRNAVSFDEIYQDVMLRLYYRGHTFKHQGGDVLPLFSSWLYRLSKNIVIDTLRKNFRHSHRLEYFDPNIDHGQSDTDENDAFSRVVVGERLSTAPDLAPKSLICQESAYLIWKAIYQLPVKYRIPIVARIALPDWNISRVAEMLGLSESTFKVQLFRGRNRLYTIIRRLGYDFHIPERSKG